MENRQQAHLRRVNRKGRCTKDSFSVGEIVRVQDIKSKLWDTEAVITGTRVAADGRIVSYDLDINGNHLRDTENKIVTYLIERLILLRKLLLMNQEFLKPEVVK